MEGFVLVTSLVTFFIATVSSEHWSYEKIDEWPEECIKGTEQSPINIQKNVTTPTFFSEMIFYNYYNASMALQNNGHVVELRISNDVEASLLPNIAGGLLGTEQYVLDNFHFHWDSEHTLDGSSYPLEGHFLHFKSGLGNLSNSLNYVHGFAILSVMYVIEDSCPNNSFNDIIDKVDKVSRNVGVSVELSQHINIHSLFPKDLNKYFVYNGSFTTPDCTEGAIWIVFEEPGCILQSQLQKLSNVYTEDDHQLSSNKRPLQDLNRRHVLYSSTPPTDIIKKGNLCYLVLFTVLLLVYN